ncbi:MAG: alpha/beta fold hydrolase [Rhodospirillaceae bacterium]|nr:alpha/beta fold hydrolase [Rhodospirillaceae bacterium]
MNRALAWEADGPAWPHSAASRFVDAAGLRWHVQIKGKGPVMVLVHGTGASTHSWRGCVDRLARGFTVVVPDLPGHGFTELPDNDRLSLPGMAAALLALLAELKVKPAVVVGHSAGAAIAVRAALDGGIHPKAIVSLNGALMPFPGLASFAFPALAKVLFLNPFAVPIAARLAIDPDAVASVIRRTGSEIDGEDLAYYTRLFADRRHIAATIGMMANWDLSSLRDDIHALKPRLTLVSDDTDLAVPPWVARAVKERLPAARIIALSGQGHLAHEKSPKLICDLIESCAFEAGVKFERR